MYQTIKKRDGRKVKFDASKITKAIAPKLANSTKKPLLSLLIKYLNS